MQDSRIAATRATRATRAAAVMSVAAVAAVAAVTAVTVVAALVLAGCDSATAPAASAAPAAPARSPLVVQVSVSSCGQGWSGGAAGPQAFEVHDVDSRSAEVSLVDPGDGAVYATVDPLGPGRTANLSVTLPAGRFAFRCAMEDEDVVTGPTVTLATPAGQAGVTAAAPVRPVTQQDLLPATRAYTSYVARRLPSLVRDTRRLHTALVHGHQAAAKQAWLVAHLDYERLGAAYGAFGDLDGEINGLPTGRPNGLRDSDFTGFHRVEFDLWGGRSNRVLAKEAATLVGLVRDLRRDFPTAQIDPADVSIRAHEIIENALQFELTGQTDLGSHTTLATVRANLQGTQAVLAVLAPLLRARYPALPQVQAAVARAERDLDAHHHGQRWTPLAALSRRGRERVDADISELTEQLAPVAAILEPRRQP